MDGTMMFRGTNFGSCAPKRNLSGYAVGLYDPATSEMKLCKIETIYEMTPTLLRSDMS